jgi:Na+-driven multidrug efflux pump
MSRSGRAARGFLTSLIQFSSQILLQAVLAPIVLKYAGREALGAYAGIMQAINLLALVDIAHAWSLERFLGQASGLGDGGARFRAVFTTARTLALITNAVYALLVLAFSHWIARLFHLSPAIADQARHALYVIAIWSVARTPLVAYMAASFATQDLAAVNLIGTVLQTTRTVLSLVFVIAGTGLFGLMLAGSAGEAVGSILYRMRFKSKNPSLMPGWGVPDKPLFREMIHFGFHAMFLNVGNMLVFSSGNALAGLTNGAASASTFYTSQMPAMTAYLLVLRLQDNSMPAVNELFGRGEIDRMRAAFLRLTRVILLLALPLAVGVFLFNRDLVVTWVGPQQYAGFLLTSSLSLFVIVSTLQRIGIAFSFVLGWMRLLTGTAFAQGLANFGLAWVLGKKMGLGGITLALLIVVLPQTFILWHRLGRYFDFGVAGFLARFALRCVLPLIAASAAGLAVHAHVAIQHGRFGGLAAEGLAFVIVYALTAYPFLASADRGEVKRYLRGFWKMGRSAHKRLLASQGSGLS